MAEDKNYKVNQLKCQEKSDQTVWYLNRKICPIRIPISNYYVKGTNFR